MRDEYVLYLDESEFKKTKIFAIAGIAIKKEKISLIEQEVAKVKELIWAKEYIDLNNPILHCTELQKIFVNRKSNNITSVREEYQEFIKKSSEDIEKIYVQIYGRLSQILKKVDATVFSCIINMQKLNELFYIDKEHNGIHLIEDKYNIALQNIIENFTHYLSVKDGYGDIIYESRNTSGENSPNSPDVKLVNAYHKIQANNKGIVYIDSREIQNRNRTMVIYSKNENLAGLQLADFVAYNIIKLENCKVAEQITDFMKQIHRMSYNGGYPISEKDQRSFWGMRVIPSYLKMEELIMSNKSLKNANNNLKKERNKLKKTIEEKEEKIKRLQDQVEKLNMERKKLIP